MKRPYAGIAYALRHERFLRRPLKAKPGHLDLQGTSVARTPVAWPVLPVGRAPLPPEWLEWLSAPPAPPLLSTLITASGS